MARRSPTTQTVDKEQVRMLVADVGFGEASIRTGIKRDTLYKWALRYHWNKPIVHAQAVQSVQPIADIHAAELQNHEKETRLSLARYAARASKDAETVTLREAPLVHKVYQTAAGVHRWEANERQQSNVMVNVALLGIDPKVMQRPVDQDITDQE